jgi:hypothetical protein
MELVILSTVAVVAILIGELRDLAGHQALATVGTHASPRSAAVTNLTLTGGAANEESAAPRPELDRAA